ncbi:hypothetical protein E4P28_02250 [Rothia dentocariosa]|nr:hypothetical protein E4P28_02250 [Rothia dentocariosa]
MVEIIVYSFHEFLMRRFLPVSLYPCAKVERIRERNPAMFTIVVPPDYTEELQQICGLDASQREKLISLLALAWLDWKQQHLSALEVAEDIVRIVREQEIFSHAEHLQQWAESMDEMYLEELDADKPYDIVQPLFYRARFAASLSYAQDALTEDKSLDYLLYEYSFSQETDTDHLMLDALRAARQGP